MKWIYLTFTVDSSFNLAPEISVYNKVCLCSYLLPSVLPLNLLLPSGLPLNLLLPSGLPLNLLLPSGLPMKLPVTLGFTPESTSNSQV